MKLYNQKAHVYHKLYKEIFDYAKEFSVFHEILQKREHKVKKVLELGCGSGSVTKYFLEEYECTGLDLSSEMVNIARELYPQGKFMQGDMRNLPDSFNNQLDAVVSTGRSFTHLTTNKDCLDCCESVFRVLKPGGLFIFDNFRSSDFGKSLLTNIIFYVNDNVKKNLTNSSGNYFY